MPKEPYRTVEEIEAVLIQKRGIVNQAYKPLGYTSREALYARIRRSPRLQRALEAARQHILDDAETVLLTALHSDDGNRSLIASKYILSTIGKQRGWVERTEITGKDGEPIKIVFEDVTSETH